MPQLITYGNELIRINTQKNSIEVSANSGRTWNTRSSGTTAGKFIDLLAYGKEILACTSKGVFSSVNEGRTWNVRYNGSIYGEFRELNIDGRNLLATTSKGLYYSTNDGRTWNRRS